MTHVSFFARRQAYSRDYSTQSAANLLPTAYIRGPPTRGVTRTQRPSRSDCASCSDAAQLFRHPHPGGAAARITRRDRTLDCQHLTNGRSQRAVDAGQFLVA